MRWILSAGKSPRRPARRAPRRNRSWIVEDLEGRRLPSATIQPIATVPAGSTTKLISGPDGDLWVGVNTTPIAAQIDRIGLDGTVTAFPVPEDGAAGAFSLASLATGPDGNVWFDAEIGPDANHEQVVIGDVTPAGVVTEFPPIPVPAGLTATATTIVNGPDGDLWFGYSVTTPRLKDVMNQSYLGRVTTAGSVTLFPISSFGRKSPGLVPSLAAGSDGNLWFTTLGPGQDYVVGRMSPSGVVTRVPVGKLRIATLADGPDGSLLVTGTNRRLKTEVYRVTTAGAVSQYDVPTASKAFVESLGPAGGSNWFTGDLPSTLEIGQIAADGAVTSYDLTHFVSGRWNSAVSMASGSDGQLYLLADALGAGVSSTATVYRFSPD